jgi:PEP-CTERM motif
MQMNKKIISVLSAAVLSLGTFATTHAALLAVDTFTQPDGTNLLGTTPDIGGTVATQSGTTAPILIENDAAVVNEATGVQDDNVPFATQSPAFVVGAGTVLYSSFTVNVPQPTGTLTTVNFAEFLQGTSSFLSRVFVTTPTTSGFRIGLAQGSTLSAATGVFSSDLTFGTTYTVVTSYDFTNKNGMLWIDPTSTSAASLGTTTDAGFSDAVTAYAFRQSASTGNVIISVDNLQVGTSFADVVPEPATLSLLGMGAIGMMARRRK